MVFLIMGIITCDTRIANTTAKDEQEVTMSDRNKFIQSLKCILTDSEKQELGSQMAEAVARVNEAEQELKSVSTQIKSKIAVDEALISGCSEKIRSGYEFRKVECEEVKDYENDRVTILRLDNFHVVSSREMKPEERQKELKMGNGNGDRVEEPAMQDV